MAALGVQRFINSTAVTARALDFTGLYSDGTNTGPWYKQANNGASNAIGIGIGTQTGLSADVNASWTLNDQFGIARTAALGNQKSQVIGARGYVQRNGNIATTWDKSQPLYTPAGAASSGLAVSPAYASQTAQPIFSVTNPANITTSNGGSVPNPDPAAPLPVGGGVPQILTLAAGWVTN